MIKTIALLILFFSVQLLCAQDKSALAKVIYGQAEDLFNAGKYEQSLQKLFETETLLGKSNTKILYLKVSVYDKLLLGNWRYNTDLQKAIDDFFAIVNKAEYPETKYMEMTRISLQLAESKSKYESGYNTSKNSKNMENMQAYINKYPGSIHATDIQADYNKLLKMQKIQEFESYKSSAMKDYHKKYGSGVAMITFGTTFLAIGTVLIVDGAQYKTVYQFVGGETTREYPTKSKIEFCAGSLLMAASIPLLVLGPLRISKALNIKRGLVTREAELSFNPVINPLAGNVALNGILKF